MTIITSIFSVTIYRIKPIAYLLNSVFAFNKMWLPLTLNNFQTRRKRAYLKLKSVAVNMPLSRFLKITFQSPLYRINTGTR